MVWDKPRILAALRKLDKADRDLSYKAMSRARQSLLSAATYHFGSYRAAILDAGIDYASVTRRPRWTKQRIIALLKQSRRAGDDLHWSAVTSRRDDLARAAYAAVQPRLFGSWARALVAAGLDSDEVSRYRVWDRPSIVAELRERYAADLPLNSGAVQVDDPSLHAAAVRWFERYDAAVRAARLNPDAIRLRRRWSRTSVIAELRSRARRRLPMADSAVRRDQPALYGAAVRWFGLYTTARAAARTKATAAS